MIVSIMIKSHASSYAIIVIPMKQLPSTMDINAMNNEISGAPKQITSSSYDVILSDNGHACCSDVNLKDIGKRKIYHTVRKHNETKTASMLSQNQM